MLNEIFEIIDDIQMTDAAKRELKERIKALFVSKYGSNFVTNMETEIERLKAMAAQEGLLLSNGDICFIQEVAMDATKRFGRKVLPTEVFSLPWVLFYERGVGNHPRSHEENTMKKQVKIDKAEIRQLIEKGDNCDGNYILIVRADGSPETGWMSRNGEYRQEREGDYVFEIPALDPDGSGLASEDGWRLAENSSAITESEEEIEGICDAEDWSIVEFLEHRYPEEWAEERSQTLDFLLSGWLEALNGEPNYLYKEPSYFYEYFDGQEMQVKEQKFEFMYAE